MENDLILMLEGFLKGHTLTIEDTKLPMLLAKAKEQALLPYPYLVYQRKEFKSYYIASCITQDKFIKLQEKLTALFNENHIRHFYIKGSVLYALYPDEGLRTRGDIDVVVEEDDFLKAKALLIASNYEMEDDENCQHHIAFHYEGLEVELHYALLDTYDASYSFFKDCFRHTVLIKDCLYELEYEYHFVFCLCHFARHLKLGAGLRYILDFYYMLKKWNMDLDKLHSMIRLLHLERLYENILNTIFYLTEEKLDTLEEYDIDFFISYLLESGIHGYANPKDKGIPSKDNKLKVILTGTFMTNKTFRISLYPRLGKHWFTYPICLFLRIITLIFTKTKKLFYYLFSKKNRVSKEEKELNKKLGI